jgi:hypothetical protein
VAGSSRATACSDVAVETPRIVVFAAMESVEFVEIALDCLLEPKLDGLAFDRDFSQPLASTCFRKQALASVATLPSLASNLLLTIGVSVTQKSHDTRPAE